MGKKPVESSSIDESPGRVIGIRQENDTCVRANGTGDGVQIESIIAHGNFDQASSGCFGCNMTNERSLVIALSPGASKVREMMPRSEVEPAVTSTSSGGSL